MTSQGEWTVLTLRDPVSASTHFAAFLWAVFGALILWRLCRNDAAKRFSVACFSVSVCVLYAASATYHALSLPPPDLQFFQRLDHSAIYALIAGTYTPIFFVLLRGRARWRLLGLIWSLAIVGIACKWVLPGTLYPVTVLCYLLVGWVGLLPLLELSRAVGRGITWGIAGGLFYTVGALCDLVGWPVFYPGVVGAHEVFHILDMGGTLAHFIFIAQYVVPYPRQMPSSTEVLLPLPEPGLALKQSA